MWEDCPKNCYKLVIVEFFRKLESSPLNPKFMGEKVGLVRRAMKENGIDAWIIFSREANEDPLVADLGLGSLVFRAAAVLDSNGNSIVCLNPFDVQTIRKRGFYEQIHDYGSAGIGQKLYEVVSGLRPEKIAVNTSEDFSLADGLSSGLRNYLVRSLQEYGDKLVSSEELVISLRAKLIPREIELVKKSVAKCERIYDETEDFINTERTDKEIHDFMKKKVSSKGLEVAWDQAPSVAIGRFPASHLSYVNRKLRKGDFLRIDFGVKYEGYCSDIQRVFFMGDGAIPSELQRMFDTATRANDSCITAMKEGVPGYIGDKAARDVVLSAGYPDFNHGTGHAVGRFVHEVGPQLEPRWPDLITVADRPIQSSMVFTVEPSVQGKFGLCNLEQDVMVTGNGVIRLSKRQDDFIRR